MEGGWRLPPHAMPFPAGAAKRGFIGYNLPSPKYVHTKFVTGQGALESAITILPARYPD
jgi:hypothetical protein